MNNSDGPNLPNQQKSNVKKHVFLRAGFLVFTILLLLTCAAYTKNGWWVLTGLFFGFGFAIIWFLFILIESFILFSKKNNVLAISNIIMLTFLIVFGAIMFYKLNQ